jgi:hypothetical protein
MYNEMNDETSFEALMANSGILDEIGQRQQLRRICQLFPGRGGLQGTVGSQAYRYSTGTLLGGGW